MSFLAAFPFAMRSTARGDYDVEEVAPLRSNSLSESCSDDDLSSPSPDRKAKTELDAPRLESGREMRWPSSSRRVNPGRAALKAGLALVAVGALGFLLGACWPGRARLEPLDRVDVEPHSSQPNAAEVASTSLRTAQQTLPPCERTLLIDWGSFTWGFGATTIITLYFAQQFNYTPLFARDVNNYGAYLHHFTPAPLDCYAPEALYQVDFYRKDDGTTAELNDLLQAAEPPDVTRPSVNRVIAAWEIMNELSAWLDRTLFTPADLEALPKLNASHLVPAEWTVPEVLHPIFERYADITAEHYSFNAQLEARVSAILANLGLDQGKRDRPIVGVHFRGGDKIQTECSSAHSEYYTCGNITHHCATAWDAVPRSWLNTPLRHKRTLKPRLLLMTTEPDALDQFRADPVCQQFDVELMPSRDTKEEFWQSNFNALLLDERLDDTHNLLAEAEILANYVDAAVISANSNVGRLILLRGGVRRAVYDQAIHSVDVYFHPTHWQPT
ncbi:hypothetical protein JCM1840_000435 [Sporobolomyces johnsonii]